MTELPEDDIVERLRNEADQCANDGADDICDLLHNASDEIERLREAHSAPSVGAAEVKDSNPDMDRFIFAWFNDRDCHEMLACLEAFAALQGTTKP